MPRSFDGPIPERPARNALPERMDDLLDGLGANRPDPGGHGGGSHPRLQDFLDRGDHVRTPPTFDLPQQGRGLHHGDNDPAGSVQRAAAPIVEEAAAQRNFVDAGEGGAEFTPRPGVHDLMKTHEFTHDWFFP